MRVYASESEDNFIGYQDHGSFYTFFWGYNPNIHDTLNEPIIDNLYLQFFMRFLFLLAMLFLAIIGPLYQGLKEYLGVN
jgi:hypothetical protein